VTTTGNTAPAFQFFARDWLADPNVTVMPLAAQGAYVRLLCAYWLEGQLPHDPETLRAIAGASAKEWRAIWPHLEPRLPPDPDNHHSRFNRRLARQRTESDEFRQAKRRAGIASGQARRQKEHNGEHT
jgi:uncharacterized protein YdaU (DUF1376 family)